MREESTGGLETEQSIWGGKWAVARVQYIGADAECVCQCIGYEVANLADTLTKAKGMGVVVLVQPYVAGKMF